MSADDSIVLQSYSDQWPILADNEIKQMQALIPALANRRIDEHLRFRDYLRSDSQLAREYQVLKLDLAEKFRHDREAYTKAKSTFIQKALGRGE